VASYTPFTSNYSDISNDLGYQFEFRCDVCGNGYKSEFTRSALGTASNLLSGAGNLIGGLFGASGAADSLKDLTDQGARDAALKKAADEIMPLFRKCPRDHQWVDESCWNEQRGLCLGCAPKLAAEMEAVRAEVELDQMREAVQAQQVFSGDTSARATVCPGCGKPVGSERFCSNCGTALGRSTCPQCGGELAPGARFCPNCGSKLG
jgi:hypothetical protein